MEKEIANQGLNYICTYSEKHSMAKNILPVHLLEAFQMTLFQHIFYPHIHSL